MAFGMVVVLSAALVSPAVGGPRYLTVGQAKKTYVSKAGAKQTYLRKSGNVRVPVQPSSWIRGSTQANVSVTTRPYVTIVSTSADNVKDVDLFAPAYAVSPLGGTSYSLVGVEVCYEFTDQAVDQGVVDRITVERAGGSTVDPVDGGLTTVFSDGTGRIDSACTTLKFAPVPLTAGDSLGIGVRLDYTDANAQVLLGRGSLILKARKP